MGAAIKEYFVSFWPKALPVLWTVLSALVILGVGVLLIRLLLGITRKGLAKSRLHVTMHTILLSAIRIAAYALLAIVVMQVLGIPTTSLITAIGAAGVAIGLALKDSLSSLAAGMLILINGNIKVGEVVELDGNLGTVMEIGLMYTTIKTFDNRHITLSNSTVVSSKIVNLSREKLRRLDMVFSIAYGDDVQRAISIIKQKLEEHKERVLSEPAEPFVRMTALDDSAIKITLRVWTKAEDLWPLNFDLLEEVKQAFEQNGIHIPFNQLDVHLRRDD